VYNGIIKFVEVVWMLLWTAVQIRPPPPKAH